MRGERMTGQYPGQRSNTGRFRRSGSPVVSDLAARTGIQVLGRKRRKGMGEHVDAFCSWSGGKDCCLAVYRAAASGYRVRVLISYVDEMGRSSRSHGLPATVLRQQARCMGMEMLFAPVPDVRRGTVEALHAAAEEALRKGCRWGVFGDIFVKDHREWIERMGHECGFRPLFPLWGEDTSGLAREFIDSGFKALVVSVRKGVLDPGHLGRDFDDSFLSHLERMAVDPCGENGEFHTLVYDGPLFDEPLDFTPVGIKESDGAFQLEIRLGPVGQFHDGKMERPSSFLGMQVAGENIPHQAHVRRE